jgi:hypothetical protein
MSNVRLYMNKVNGWEKIDTAMTVNDPEVGHLGFKLPILRTNSQPVRAARSPRGREADDHAGHAAADR